MTKLYFLMDYGRFKSVLSGMKVSIIFLIMAIAVITPEVLHATEFRVKMFSKAPQDLSAIFIKYKRLDDNDLVCAIIKVRSDIEGLKFTASTPIVGSVEKRFGEYWVYVSEGTRQLSIYADGYIKLSYTFPEKIEQGKVYIMEVTSRPGTVIDTGKGNLKINSEPSGVNVLIDGFPDLKKTTPCSFDNYRSGIYRFSFSKNRYIPFDTVISIDKQATKQIFIKLKPVWGDLNISTGNLYSTFQINGKTYTGSLLNLSGEEKGLKEGIYQLKISSDNYYDTLINIAIKAEHTTSMRVLLRPVKTSVNITSVPGGAEVFIDGRRVGYTPYRADLITGKHTLTISKNGYINETKTINLVKNEPYFLSIPLRTHAKILITSSPAGAKIFLNNKYMGKTPEKITISTGSNSLRLEKKNYMKLTKNITVVPDTTFWFQLKEKKYNLTVKSFPQGADIIINGRNIGSTNKSLGLKYGSYKVKLYKKGYVTRKRSFTLDSDKKISVNMPKRINGDLGIVFFSPAGDYGTFKYGVEIGWSYQKMPHFLTSLGMAYGECSDFDEELRSWGITKVNESNYKDLNFSSLSPSDFATENTTVIFMRIGWLIYKPFVFSLTSVLGYFAYNGYNVYTAHKDYESDNYHDLYQGDEFINQNGKIKDKKFKYGFGAIIKFSSFYFNLDYWIPSGDINHGTKFSFGIGIML